jgi:hypothetical protein
MGIRFFCPNGHKLHVKSQLAGLRAYCPDCGAVLVIPLQSTRKSGKDGGGLIENNETQSNNETQNANLLSDFLPDSNNTADNTIGNTATPQDLLNPSIDWFVCDPENGEQQGPFKNKSLKQLAQNHQIKPHFYIWREGLTDWVPASLIFTGLK